MKRESATRSANSYLRCARALFSRKWLKEVGGRIRLPEPLPFEGVSIEAGRSRRYQSRIKLESLIGAAQKTLSAESPSAYLAFLLALGAGLRKSEIDGLEWTHVNFQRAVISIEPTAHRDLKTESSAAEVQIDFALRDELKRLKGCSKGVFVVDGEGRHRPELDRQHYRAQAVFDRLYAWLRKNGVTDPKPLHALRKEFGSRINQRFGLYAAMTALRHAEIATTANHYLANTQRVAFSLPGLRRPRRRNSQE